MALIDRIVPVTITRETIFAVSNNFGRILILGNSVPALDPNVKEYSSLTEVVADFATNTPEYIKASKIFAQFIRTPKILIGQVRVDDADYTSAYTRISADRNDFYAVDVCVNDNDIDDIIALMAVVETQKKIFGTSTDNADVLSNFGDNLFKRAKTSNFSRSFGIYSVAPRNTNYPESALFGKMIPTTPGSTTWGLQNLVNVIPSNNLTDVNITDLETNSANFYTFFGGRDCLLNGTMFNGEFIDTIVGLDWLEFYIQSNLATLLTSVANRYDKIPYNDNGINLIKNNLNASLEQAVTNGIIEPDFTITVPEILNVSAVDKAARTLNNVEFEATTTGAIQRIVTQGSISL